MPTVVTGLVLSISAFLRDATRTLDGAAVEVALSYLYGVLLARASRREVRQATLPD
ncbi:hypothetical protein [Nostoc sp.]|uniref:hypothetical protein n=1 Tax=Nostoc sp. TaxID=1180 RepID=UPI002FFB119F